MNKKEMTSLIDLTAERQDPISDFDDRLSEELNLGLKEEELTGDYKVFPDEESLNPEDEAVLNPEEGVVEKKKSSRSSSKQKKQIESNSYEVQELRERVAQLEQVAQSYEQQNAYLAQHSQVLSQQLEQNHEQLFNENQSKIELEKNALRTRILSLKKEKKEAFDSGDSDSFDAFSDAITEAQIRLHELDKQEQEPDFQENTFIPPLPYVPPVRQQETYISPEFREWLAENPWCNPQTRDFDQNLAAEATAIDQEMKKYCKINGLSDAIGTREYYDQITDIMKSKYGQGLDNDEPQFQNRHSRVEPVSRFHHGRSSYEASDRKTMAKNQLDILNKIIEYNPDGTPMTLQQKIKFLKG